MADGAVDAAALSDEGAGSLSAFCNKTGGQSIVSGVDLAAFFAVEVEGRICTQQFHVGLPQGVDGAHILPVALEFVGVELMSRCQERRNNVLAEVVFGGGILLVGNEELAQNLPFEYVDTHGGVGALRMLRFFLELVDGAVGIGVHDAEAAGLLNGHRAHGDGAVSILLLGIAEHGSVIHFVNMVAGKNQDVIRIIALNKGDVLVDGVGRSLVPLGFFAPGIGRKNLNAAVGTVQMPGLTVSDILVKLQRLILGQNSHRINAGVDAVGQREINDAVLTAKRNCRFRGVFRQHHQTAALATGQKHGNTMLFLEVHAHSLLVIFWVSAGSPFVCSMSPTTVQG